MATKAKKKKASHVTLQDLFIIKLRSLADIEDQIIKALPKMAKAASDPELKKAFTSHLTETKEQANRLKDALAELNAPNKGKEKVEAIRGLIKDGEWIIKTIKDPAARDAMLIGAAQYVEHYEIAGYTVACEWANMLSLSDVEAVLQETLGEEESASDKLEKLASATINDKVAMPTEEGEEQ